HAIFGTDATARVIVYSGPRNPTTPRRAFDPTSRLGPPLPLDPFMTSSSSDARDGDPIEPARPTRARFVVLGALCLLSGILYLDRICISAALDSIQKDLTLSNTEGSYVLMAFTLAYGLFEIPT